VDLEAGAERARVVAPKQLTVCGLAVESIEAWTLGAPEALAEELAVDVEQVRALYPAGVGVEELYENSGKEQHRPKRLLQRIAQLKHRNDTTAFRQAVAERTAVVALENVCERGFAPFAKKLRGTLGS
jgi:hypothetical protein